MSPEVNKKSARNAKQQNDNKELSPGMHVAAAWLKDDSTEYTWFLGEFWKDSSPPPR